MRLVQAVNDRAVPEQAHLPAMLDHAPDPVHNALGGLVHAGTPTSCGTGGNQSAGWFA